MIAVEPTPARSAVDCSQMLQPFGLTEASLSQALRFITEPLSDS